ncbi:MAG TPA: hypothetical protein VEB42_06180 [Chitinophagaceae bacterium]|nr:hypothetical protein [Chitinophagaceae bacterium]
MKTIATLCLILTAMTMMAQAPSAMTDAIKKLAFLEGTWKGQGWIKTGGQKQLFNETETAKIKTGGTLLQIDVFGTDVKEETRIINNGLAIVRYDTTRRTYLMDFYQSDGSVAEATVEVVNENTASILINRQGSFTRFVIRVKNNRWFEQGFHSRDGKDWTQFFEMDLARDD